MKTFTKIFLSVLTVFSLMPAMALAENQVAQVEKHQSIISFVNRQLAKAGMSPLNNRELNNFLFDLNQIVNDIPGFISFVYDMREAKNEICGIGGCYREPVPMSP